MGSPGGLGIHGTWGMGTKGTHRDVQGEEDLKYAPGWCQNWLDKNDSDIHLHNTVREQGYPN